MFVKDHAASHYTTVSASSVGFHQLLYLNHIYFKLGEPIFSMCRLPGFSVIPGYSVACHYRGIYNFPNKLWMMKPKCTITVI